MARLLVLGEQLPPGLLELELGRGQLSANRAPISNEDVGRWICAMRTVEIMSTKKSFSLKPQDSMSLSSGRILPAKISAIWVDSKPHGAHQRK